MLCDRLEHLFLPEHGQVFTLPAVSSPVDRARYSMPEGWAHLML